MQGQKNTTIWAANSIRVGARDESVACSGEMNGWRDCSTSTRTQKLDVIHRRKMANVYTTLGRKWPHLPSHERTMSLLCISFCAQEEKFYVPAVSLRRRYAPFK